MFKELTSFFTAPPVQREARTLDSLVDRADLIKADLQGAELEALSGKLLDTATVVQVEMPLFGVYNRGAPIFA
eukprot:7355639-Prymnesium_polylepis.1